MLLREVNEIKVKALLGADIVANDLSDQDTLVAGNIGPVGLNDENIIMMFDESLKGENDLVCGANKKDYHITGLTIERDIKDVKFVDVSKVKDGDICPRCGGKFYISRGIEIGNIFQLGTKYTKSMKMNVHSRTGEDFNPIMGCYGIGVGRALASVLEEKSDEKGLVFPMTIAPWHVCLCPLKHEDEKVSAVVEKLYEDLTKNRVEVLLDDRTGVSPGFKFAESELMGLPIRVVVSPRSLENNQAEVTMRATGETKMVAIDNLVEELKNIIKTEIEKIEN